MSFPFDPTQDLIVVPAAVTNPEGDVFVVNLVVDTGATNTVINVGVLMAMGYDPLLATDHFRILTGSGVESVSSVKLRNITTLGKSRDDFPAISHSLPLHAGINGMDGVLGLDFFRGHLVTIDFRRGRISLD